jgi:orotidine-5'-phosphate decarboxylase
LYIVTPEKVMARKACPPTIPIIVAFKRHHTDGSMAQMRNKIPGSAFRIGIGSLFKYGGDKIQALFANRHYMLDLKLNDIPDTVAGDCMGIAQCAVPPWILTIHASGGSEMITSAVRALADSPVNVVAVTLLTSIDAPECIKMCRRRPLKQVLKLAEKAIEAGADGLVCSPQEVQVLRKKYPNTMLVVPGGRSEGTSHGDQKRVGTFEHVLSAGGSNTFLVIGREITDAEVPHEAYEKIVKRLGLTPSA